MGQPLRDVAVRRRIWKLARRIAIRSTEDAFTSFQGNCQAEIARLMLFKVTRDRFLKASKKLASAGDVDPEMLAEDEAVIEPRF